MIKYGRPRLCFHINECSVHLFALSIVIQYKTVSSLTFQTIENDFRGMTQKDHHLTLYLNQKTPQHHLLRKKTKQVKSFLIQPQQMFTNQQILELAVILTALCRSKPNKRRDILKNLENKTSNYEALASKIHLKKYKNNQYVSNSFHSEQ